MNSQSPNSSSQSTPQLSQAAAAQASWEAACNAVQHDLTKATIDKLRVLLTDVERIPKIIDYAIKFGRRPRRKDLEQDVWDRSNSREKFRKIVNEVLRRLPPTRYGKRRQRRVPRWARELEKSLVSTLLPTKIPNPPAPKPVNQQLAPVEASAVPGLPPLVQAASAQPATRSPMSLEVEMLRRMLGKSDLGAPIAKPAQ